MTNLSKHPRLPCSPAKLADSIRDGDFYSSAGREDASGAPLLQFQRGIYASRTHDTLIERIGQFRLDAAVMRPRELFRRSHPDASPIELANLAFSRFTKSVDSALSTWITKNGISLNNLASLTRDSDRDLILRAISELPPDELHFSLVGADFNEVIMDSGRFDEVVGYLNADILFDCLGTLGADDLTRLCDEGVKQHPSYRDYFKPTQVLTWASTFSHHGGVSKYEWLESLLCSDDDFLPPATVQERTVQALVDLVDRDITPDLPSASTWLTDHLAYKVPADVPSAVAMLQVLQGCGGGVPYTSGPRPGSDAESLLNGDYYKVWDQARGILQTQQNMVDVIEIAASSSVATSLVSRRAPSI